MLPLNNAFKSSCFLGFLITFSLSAWAEPHLTKQGGEQQILGPFKRDQVNAALSLSPAGGYITWDQNGTDKTGRGIGYAQLDGDLNGSNVRLVPKSATGNQDHPQIQRLLKGQTLFVWQGNPAGMPDIYARILAPNNVFSTSDIRLNTYTPDQQVTPVATALKNGNALVAWGSYGQDHDMMGVYARVVTAAGLAPKPEFRVNQVTALNQRNPAVATLENGNFVVVWISEGESAFGSIDVFGRIFTPVGLPITDEFRINRGKDKCADPAIASLTGGGFTVVWSQLDGANLDNGWDIEGASFGASGQATTPNFKINTYVYGDQYRPKIATGSAGCLVVWTSLFQDGDREGVFGRFLVGGNRVSGEEFQINATTVSQQILPTVAWNGVDRFVVAWSSPIAGYGFNLFGQMYILNQ